MNTRIVNTPIQFNMDQPIGRGFGGALSKREVPEMLGDTVC